jgi:formiminotetrahydrofolate cyclodeaminase
VAFELLQAAAAAAAANARVNLASVHDSGFSAGAEAEAQRLSAAMQAIASEAHQAGDRGM